MIRWYRHILKNPTRYFMLFYAMLIWRVLAVYFGITALSLFVIFLFSLVGYLVYGALRDLASHRRIALSLGILLLCLPLSNLLETHIIYALYRIEGIRWTVGLSPFIALYPVLLIVWLLIQDRYFHPLGTVVSLPFVIFSWITLIQNQLKVWIILYLFLTLIEASGWVYARTRKRSRRQDLRVMPRKRMMVVTALVFVLLTPALFFPLSCLGTRRLGDILDPDNAPSSYITEFNLHSLGYGDGTTLGGPIKLDDELLLTVEADAPLYLRGNVMDLYTGHAWEKTGSEYQRQGEYAVHEVDKDSRRYIDADVSETRVYPAVSDANVFFTPLHAVYIYSKAKVWYDRHYIFYMLSRRHRTKPYTVLYKDIDYGTEYDYPLEAVQGADAYGPYLQVPDTITRRTYDLVHSITGDAATASEKVEAIRRYLAENYTYSLFMTAPPPDVDFVEHFLFEEKEGYCTYFATSAAVMCRIAGIPSRYIQGFMLNAEKMNPEGHYLLSGEEGHAWIEVLTSPEDNLWTRVECTPGRDTAPGTAAILPEPTPPPFGDTAIPLDLPGSLSGARKGFIGEHLFILILLLAAGALAFAGIRIASRIRTSMFTDPSILPLYGRIRSKLIPAGIFTDGARTDLDEVAAVRDDTLRGYLEAIVAQYYDEFYGGIQKDSGMDRQAAYSYIAKYARRNSTKRRHGRRNN